MLKFHFSFTLQYNYDKTAIILKKQHELNTYKKVFFLYLFI